MRMISDHRILFFGLLFPIMASAAGQPCHLNGGERAGQGWLYAKNNPRGVLSFVISLNEFESVPKSRTWVINLQARDAALKSFKDYLRKISPPVSANSDLVVKGLQVKELKCIEGIFVSYEVNQANLSWESPIGQSAQTKEEVMPPFGASKVAIEE